MTLKASPDQCSQLITVLINAIAKEENVSEKWKNNYEFVQR